MRFDGKAGDRASDQLEPLRDDPRGQGVPSPSPEAPGRPLANVSSMGGFLPVPGQTIYGASKAAVKLMTEGLYAELLETNVAVTVVLPGAVSTDITANSGVDAPGGGAADESNYRTTSSEGAAKIILDGMEEDKLPSMSDGTPA